jgi:acyl-CoA reductase-like NAD-dependent aldehyde dehydrogenase
MFGGFTADVWIERGKPATQGAIYREAPRGDGKVALVLGAGNVSSIAPMDALYKLFVENEVVLLKMNPVNEAIGLPIEDALRPLVDAGFLAVAYGGADVGAYLAEHRLVDTLHVTGSDRTYDAIVWGADPAEQAKRKAANDPKNTRPFSAELGCVTPVLIVPGPWSASDMEFQARHVAAMVAQNASFNCNAAKVLVTAKGWLQRRRFLELVDEALARTAPRKAYYPGAGKRYEAFVAKYPRARAIGPTGEGIVPWTVIPDVAPAEGEYALTNEAFCGVLAEVSLDAEDAPSFLRAAVDFANDRCWGTLSCGLFVHPATERDHAASIDDAIARLRYGGIGVNCWPAVVYALGVTTWGAFPGHPPTDIRSGAGVVHNALLFDHPEKSVVRAPFRIRPTPEWFADHKNLAEVGRKLLRQEAAPSWGGVLRVAGAAIKG